VHRAAVATGPAPDRSKDPTKLRLRGSTNRVRKALPDGLGTRSILLLDVAPPAGVEPATNRVETGRSVH
jgi:hypothetical protein